MGLNLTESTIWAPAVTTFLLFPWQLADHARFRDKLSNLQFRVSLGSHSPKGPLKISVFFILATVSLSFHSPKCPLIKLFCMAHMILVN